MKEDSTLKKNLMLRTRGLPFIYFGIYLSPADILGLVNK